MLASLTHRRIPRSIVLVTSSHAGSFARIEGRLRAALGHQGLRVVETLDVADVARLQTWIEQPLEERPMVVAAGGDGTVGAVANYVANTKTVLGILPVGTHNDTARSLGIPQRIEQAVQLLAEGKIATVDAALFVPEQGQPRYFVHAAAAGINVAFARLATQPSLRKRLGRFTYVVASALALRERRPLTCQLRLPDGQASLCLLHLAVLNAPIFGGRFGFHFEGGSIDNRLLDVLAIEDLPLPRLVLGVAPLALGKKPQGHGVHLYRVPQVEVAAEHPVEVTLDGEIAGMLPGRFELAPEALYVVTPHSFEDIDDEEAVVAATS